MYANWLPLRPAAHVILCLIILLQSFWPLTTKFNKVLEGTCTALRGFWILAGIRGTVRENSHVGMMPVSCSPIPRSVDCCELSSGLWRHTWEPVLEPALPAASPSVPATLHLPLVMQLGPRGSSCPLRILAARGWNMNTCWPALYGPEMCRLAMPYQQQCVGSNAGGLHFVTTPSAR